MSEEIQFTKQDYLDLAAGNVEVKVERHEHYHFGVEVDPIEPPDEEENGDGDPVPATTEYFKLRIVRDATKSHHRVYTGPDLNKEWNDKETGQAVMAVDGMFVKPLGYTGDDGNQWFGAIPVELGTDAKELEVMKGWRKGNSRVKGFNVVGYLPFDLPEHSVVMDYIYQEDLPG